MDELTPQADAPPQAANRPRVQSVARAAGILFAVAQSRTGLTSRQISEHVGLARQATYHLLHTLMATGLLTRNDDRRYVMGIRVGTLGEAFRQQLAPPEYLAPQVRRIARETGETAYSVGWWHGEVATLGMARGDNAVQAAEVPLGLTGDAHARASGKLLLAHAPPAVRDDYLARHPLRPRTPHTIVDKEKLLAELARIREQGYSIDREEYAEGLCCLAAPLDRGMSPFALGLTAPRDRFEAELQRYLAITMTVCERLSSVRLGSDDQPP